jgi:cell wall-associated NlpC family hydrolase
MSNRFQRLLPAFALAALVAGVSAAAPLVSPFVAVPDAAAAAVTIEWQGRKPRLLKPKPPPPPPPTLGERAAKIALHAVGTPYRWGGESPSAGFDCSGLVRWAYRGVGILLPHNSYALYGEGRRVSRSRMKTGDVLFFEGLGHVGLYLGRGRMVHAPQSGRRVEVVRLQSSNYGLRLIGARRVDSA